MVSTRLRSASPSTVTRCGSATSPAAGSGPSSGSRAAGCSHCRSCSSPRPFGWSAAARPDPKEWIRNSATGRLIRSKTERIMNAASWSGCGAGEEGGDVAGYEFRLLTGGEVAAARHHGPPADLIEALGPLARRLAFADERVREDRDRGRHLGPLLRAQPRLALPAAVVGVIPDRGRDALADQVQGQHGQQEITGEPGLQVSAAVAP